MQCAVCFSFFSLFSPHISFSQEFTQPLPDSIVKQVCEIYRTDQLYRTKAIYDSIQLAIRNQDSTTFKWYQNKLIEIDTNNFRQLENIILNYGFPGPQLIHSHHRCSLLAVLIHWSKEYPEWFNSDASIHMFQKEITNGNLPLSFMDHALFFYRTFMPHGMEYFDLINKARKAYGLKPYSEKQFLGDEPVEPVN